MPQKRFTKTLILALLTGALFRLLFIGRAPGLHFDEAWAANYAYKIASVPGFWPIDAMSPYTHPWSHYVTAAFFKLLGPHLWVVRLAGTMMSGFGIILIAKTLGALGETKAQAYFACLAAACFASVANERFAIEINTFHVLCLGLLVYGVVLKRWLFIGASAVFGVTSHILFLAPLLAAFWVWAASDRKDKKDRVFIGMICVLLLPFFFSVYLEIPEKGKALTVILVDLLALIYVIHPFSVGFFERRLRWLLLPVVLQTQSLF
jgi:4-amino-4-deoxy-L-arabinose transferase-like glycosyltransferase